MAGGQVVTTHLIVRTEFLEDNPEAVKALLEGTVDAIDASNDDPGAAKEAVNAQLEELTDEPLDDAVIDAAWQNLTFTADPIATSLQKAPTTPRPSASSTRWTSTGSTISVR